MTKKTTKSHKKSDQYNDPEHNYLDYWKGRDYEHASEKLALRRFLKGKHFRHAADIGGGYGRLCIMLEKYADAVTLAEPSQQQLDIAKDFLKDHPKVDRKLMQADDLKFKDGELDLVTMIRVMHHIPEPTAEFAELARVLSDDGTLILEMANFTHARNKVKYLFKRKKLPTKPVDIRSEQNKGEGKIAFVNHNPKTVVKQLAHAGLKVEKVLSVSNLRSTTLKRVIPHAVMLRIENFLQPALAKTHFGPSVFFLIRKAK